VKVFAGSAPTTVVAAYSVGQQLAIAVSTAALGLAAIVFIFRFRSFREVIFAGRASRAAEREAERAEAQPESTPLQEEETRASAPSGPGLGAGY